MKRLLQTAILIVAAMIGSSILLVALITAARNLTIYGSSPADFLPAKQTKVVFHHPQEQNLKAWQKQFPALSEIMHKHQHTIAVLALEDGTHAIVTFSDAQETSSYTIGTFAVTATHDAALSLIGATQHPLGKDNVYKQLHAKKKVTDQWTYITPNALRSNKSFLNRFIRTVLLEAQPSALITNKHRIALQHTVQTSTTTQASQNIAHFHDTFLVLSIANAHKTWEYIMHTIDDDDAIVLEGLIRKWLQRFGEEVSLEADILPLLVKPSTFYATASGGNIHVLAEGSHQDNKQLAQTLARLHSSYKKTIPMYTTTKRILDKRFSSLDIRHDNTRVLDDQMERNGWTIRSTQEKESPEGLFTATKGNRYIISTNVALLYSAIKDRRTFNIPQTEEHGIFTAGAEIQPNRINELFFEHPSDQPQPEILRVSSMQIGPIHHLIFEMENAELLLDSLLH